MVAAGNIDIAVDAGLQSYDIAALVPIIEKAGGVVTTFDGGRPEEWRRHHRRGDAGTARGGARDPAGLSVKERLEPSGGDLASRARHEGVEGREQLLAVDVGFLQDLVARPSMVSSEPVLRRSA